MRCQLLTSVATLETTSFIDGRFVASSGLRCVVHLVDPFSARRIVAVEKASAEHLERAVVAARSCLASGWGLSSSTRARRDVLLGMAKLVEKHRELLAFAETIQSGKLYRDSLDEVVEGAECFRYFAGWADKITGSTYLLPSQHHGHTVMEPVGTVILKPAPTTPLSALILARLSAHLLPKGCLNILPGDAHIGALITQHPSIDMISFTGSTEVGRRVLTDAASSNLKRVVCELGGKNTAIIDRDVSVTDVAKVLVNASFANAGQNCCAASRYLIHRDIHQPLIDSLKKEIAMLRFGDPFDETTTISTLATIEQKRKIVQHLQAAQVGQVGDTIRVEMPTTPLNTLFDLTAQNDNCSVNSSDQCYIPPIVLSNVPDDHLLAQQELFGPIVTILEPWTDISQAVQRANATNYGLAAGLFSNNARHIDYFTRYMHAGTLWINTWNHSPVHMPFGGLKQSGVGKELGYEGLAEYMVTKSVIHGNL